jgi:hypothetical protein
MDSTYIPIFISEDPEAWELYKGTPYRWAFNKLEVALRQGLKAGPAATAPMFDGSYISRPIYNLYGMGIEAKRFEYKTSMNREVSNYAVVPPGSFWCEWLDGDHLSVDYRRLSKTLSWEVSSVWRGDHASVDNLTKFEKWTRVPTDLAPTLSELPLAMDWIGDPYVAGFNIEVRSGYVTEVHLRLGNTSFDDLPIGSSVVPLWDEDDIGDFEFRADDDYELEKYKAFGNISNIRKGFKILRY